MVNKDFKNYVLKLVLWRVKDENIWVIKYGVKAVNLEFSRKAIVGI